MGFGILEDRKLEHVPGKLIMFNVGDRLGVRGKSLADTHYGTGTAKVFQDERVGPGLEDEVGERNTRLKYDKTGKILLVPQPSDDPNDPLVRKSSDT
jgi:hypothetical protein